MYQLPTQVTPQYVYFHMLTPAMPSCCCYLQALGAKAFSIVPLSFCIPEDLSAWQAWLSSSGPAADTGLWMLKTGQDAGKGLRLVRTQQ
jgi:hypothetical protein